MSDPAMVLELERCRYDAMVRRDVAALDRMLSPRLVYTHSHGGRDTKESYLKALRANHVRYESIHHQVEHVVLAGSVAAAFGRMDAVVVHRTGGIRNVKSVTTAVWVLDDQAWQVLAFQATPASC